jgi:acyl-CoA thioester hydrolase
MSTVFTISQQVSTDMIDHNNHMHDSHYNHIFSDIINQFNYAHGLSLEERKTLSYTMFTAEEQTSYLQELKLDETYTVKLYLYDYDVKRAHFFAFMYKQDDTLAATNEAMMLGIDRNTNKVSPFPQQYYQQLEQYYAQQPTINWPKQLGHRIGIPK